MLTTGLSHCFRLLDWQLSSHPTSSPPPLLWSLLTQAPLERCICTESCSCGMSVGDQALPLSLSADPRSRGFTQIDQEKIYVLIP